MFEEFANRKFNDYINLIGFKEDKTSLQLIRQSALPPYILNFFECSLGQKGFSLDRLHTEDLLRKGIIFNINYVIKPKGTLLKFLFGSKETRPVEYIQQRLLFFQFYSYYIKQIYEFINLNNPAVISSKQAEALLLDVTQKLKEEIDAPDAEKERTNLIKLLYHFFLDLTENNPINIQLPKRILSVYFQDKGFTELKKRVDDFFADEIFIQEAVELMNPDYTPRKKKAEDNESRIVKDIVTKAKSGEKDTKPKSISITLSDNVGVENLTPNKVIEEATVSIKKVTLVNESDLLKPEIPKENAVKEEIYSDDLVLETPFEDNKSEPLTPEQLKEKELNDLFCEESYRTKIIKKIFGKKETLFKDTVYKLFDSSDWQSASVLIAEHFDKNNINYYSGPAVKFVDLIESYFIKRQES